MTRLLCNVQEALLYSSIVEVSVGDFKNFPMSASCLCHSSFKRKDSFISSFRYAAKSACNSEFHLVEM